MPFLCKYTKASIFGLFASLLVTPSFAEGPVDGEGEHSIVLTLNEAISLALEVDPRLAAGSFQLEANKGRTRQAGAFPNPQITAEVENFAGPDDFRGLRQAEVTGSFEQLIELGGKRRLRVKAAQGGQDAAAAELATIRRLTVARTTSDFLAVLGADAQLAVAEARVQNAERLLPALRRRVNAGASSEVDLSRGQIALDLAKIDQDRTVSELESARSQLASNWGGSATDVKRVSGELTVPASDKLSFDELLSGIESHPTLIRWDAVRQQRQADFKFEKSQRVPDVTLGAGARQIRETDETAFLFSVSIPIPVWNRNQGAIYEASQLLAKSEANRQAAYQALFRQFNSAYSNMIASCREARRVNDTIVPSAERNLALIERGYSQGRFGVLDLLDGSTVLANARRQRVDSLVTCRSSAAEIEFVTGMNPLTKSQKVEMQENTP